MKSVKYVNYIEFDKLRISSAGKGSEVFIGKYIQGPRINVGTDIMIEDLSFEINYIIQINDTVYRLINSNQSIVVGKQ
jgi:hypothetical protein